MTDSLETYCFILGASCTGKSRLAIEVSKALGGASVINTDSLQVFRGVDIGTAKPSKADLLQAPHKMFDGVPVGGTYSVANYLNDVLKVISNEPSGPLLFCGGSGFYIQALQKGLYPEVETTPVIKDQVYKLIEDHGFEAMYGWILEKDPEYAAKIHRKDHYRIRRGLEILMSQNLSVTALKDKMKLEAKSPLPSHHSLNIGLYWERAEQQDVVHQRTCEMLDSGWIAETQALVEHGFRDWAPLRSVGYHEILMHLDGEISLAELPQKITTATLQLIKKQTTWFKKEKNINWFHALDWQGAKKHILENMNPQ